MRFMTHIILEFKRLWIAKTKLIHHAKEFFIPIHPKELLHSTVMDLNGSKNEAEILQIAMQSDEVQNI